MATLKIPPVLRPEAGGLRQVEVAGSTVREALNELVAAHPPLERRIFVDGALPTFLNVFVDGDDIRLHEGLETQLTEASLVVLLPAVAGGSAADAASLAGLTLPEPATTLSSMPCAAEKPLAFSMIRCAQSG